MDLTHEARMGLAMATFASVDPSISDKQLRAVRIIEEAQRPFVIVPDES